MENRYSRRFILAALMAGGAGCAFAEAPATSPRPVLRGSTATAPVASKSVRSAEALIKASGLDGDIAYVVADARTGLILEARSPNTPHMPASTAKALTTLYALDTLGADYRFRTHLVATGPVSNGRLNGDLVLVGAGDPTLDTDRLAQIAARLKASGLRTISGRFLVYGGALPYIKTIDPDQPDYVGYSPSIAGLNLNYNRVHFEWKKGGNGYAVTMDARSGQVRPDVRMARMKVVERQAPLYTYASTKNIDDWTVSRRALGTGGSRWLPVRRPDIYTGEVFQSLAESNGITLPAPQVTGAVPGGTVLAAQTSAPLAEVLKEMLKYSTNMTAEVAGLTASAARGVKARDLSASGRAMSGWLAQRYGIKGASFVDHSGLGAGSRISASDMVTALVKAAPDGVLQSMMKNIPMRDAKGKPLKAHPVRVQAKTGTLNFVSALAGYMTAPDGTPLAFAIFTSNEARRARIVAAEAEAPRGAASWNKSSKTLQQALIERWAGVYGS